MSVPTVEHSPTSPDSEPQDFADKSKEKKKKLIIGGTILGAAAIGAGIVFGGSGSDSGEKVPIEHNIPTVSGDENGDGFLSKTELQDMSLEDVIDVAKHDPKLLLPAYAPDFDDWREDTNTILNNSGYFLNVDPSVNYVPTGSKEAYSDRDVLAQVTLDKADASLQHKDIETGKKMLTLVDNPDAKSFPRAIEYFEINQGNKPSVAIYKPVGESFRITAPSFDGIDLSDYSEVRLIQQQFVPSNGEIEESYTDYGLYGLVKDGENESWQMIEFFDPSYSQLNQALPALRAAEAANNQPS